jgi:hypothetical protein
MSISVKLPVTDSRKYLYKIVLALFIIYYSSFTSSAQSLSVTLDRDKIILGEQVTLQLKITDVNIHEAGISNWFQFNDTSHHIEVVKAEPVDTVDVNGLTTYLQRITITSFDSGKWLLPTFITTVQEINTGKKTILKANDIYLEVLPADVSGMQQYHDIKAIVAVKSPINIWLYVAVAASVIIVIVSLVLLFRKKKKPAVIKPAVLKGTALERALEQLKILEQQQPSSKDDMKKWYTLFEDVARKYLQEAMQVKTMQATTDELMMFVNVYLQTENIRTPFYQLLRLIAAVKYAKFIPAGEAQKQSIQTMQSSLQYIDDALNQVKKHA